MSGRMVTDATLQFVRFVQQSTAAMMVRWQQEAPLRV
jgi:hypothetical protein